MKNVCVYLAEGFEEIEAITIIDILRRAGIPVQVVSVTGQQEVTGSHRIKVAADILFEDAGHDEAGMIVLPGGMPGAENLATHQGLKKQILKFSSDGKLLGAICAAPMVFGRLGILGNKRVTCYPGFEKFLEGATVTGSKVEKSGNIVTGKGPGAAILFALEIVKMLKGEELADSLKEKMMVQ